LNVNNNEVYIMPIITIEMLEGKTFEQKKEIAKEITDCIEKITGRPRSVIQVIFRDMPKTEYYKAGEPASEWI
jgi:4-oxalocrotonate tautomerase